MDSVYSSNKKYKGHNKNQVDSFLGIPYAVPPLGELRFRAPKKIDEDTISQMTCGEWPANPVQNNTDNINEDCLYLNIWKPENVSETLPVMVWIYGGSYETGGIGKKGAGFGLTFDGEKLAQDTQCIIVTINYRINVFGFLDFSFFDSSFERNIGVKDIVCALGWVHDNIVDFGGDSNNVTLFGQSAGGALVAALTQIDEAQHLYNKMIIQSACVESFYTIEEAKDLSAYYLELLNMSTDEVSRLKNMPLAELTSVFSQLEVHVRDKILGITTFCPIVDGSYIKEFPHLGEYASDKPLIIGSTKNEGRMFARFSKQIANESGKRFFPYFSDTERTKLLSHYVNFPSFEANSQVATDIMYTVPKYWIADKCVKNNSVYMYEFDFYGGLFQFLSLRACHASDVPLLFGVGTYFYVNRFRTAQHIGKMIRHYWGNFARTGNPNGGNLPQWNAYSEDTSSVLIINKDSIVENNPNKETKKNYEGVTSFFHQI